MDSELLSNYIALDGPNKEAYLALEY
ncbi:hypothetical protein A3Q56_00029 [Intoshia linei]|uniref:Uncharacterized protein n=1 Tax=Intoshia linei TaxID=1819745 RepID=A0A177BEU0_9BILA|nr:hypothetical protein A3Q56_00029 [Intoshia linei]